jgi:hypothetical protein
VYANDEIRQKQQRIQDERTRARGTASFYSQTRRSSARAPRHRKAPGSMRALYTSKKW